MSSKTWRGAIVGASTLLGKELAEELSSAADIVWDITLLDAEDAGGTITAAGDEALVVQPVTADSFAGVDVAFFAGEDATTLKFWKAAHSAGAAIVDLTGALEGQSNVLVRSPLVSGGAAPDLATAAEVSADPAAIMLALVRTSLRDAGLETMAATVLQPASKLGNVGVEEVHQQTVSLLSFKPVPKDIYDAQVAFNLLAALGPAAKLNLDTASDTLQRQIRTLTGNDDAIALQLLQAPVFHGYAVSVFLETSESIDEAALLKMFLDGQTILQQDESPSNEVAAGKGEVLFKVAPAKSRKGSAFWLWMAADNLRLAARNAAACAGELVQLRPKTGVQ